MGRLSWTASGRFSRLQRLTLTGPADLRRRDKQLLPASLQVHVLLFICQGQILAVDEVVPGRRSNGHAPGKLLSLVMQRTATRSPAGTNPLNGARTVSRVLPLTLRDLMMQALRIQRRRVELRDIVALGGPGATVDQPEGLDPVRPMELTLEVSAQTIVRRTDRITPRVDESGQLQSWLDNGSCIGSGAVTVKLYAEVLACQTDMKHAWSLPASVPPWMREMSPDAVLQLFRFMCMLHGNFQRSEIVAVRPHVDVRIAGYLTNYTGGFAN